MAGATRSSPPGPIDAHRDPVEAALVAARAFAAGRRLAVVAPGAPDHAHHVAVEFVHPVIAGTRPLPAVAVDDPGAFGGDDLVLAVGAAGSDPGRPPDLVIDLVIDDAPADPRTDAATVRAYHLLWELVHVALEHPGLIGGPTGEGADSTGFLYPFLDGAETDEDALRAALAASASDKVEESDRVVAATLAANAPALGAAAAAVTDAVAGGRRVHTAGNGGSATDAARLVRHLRAVGVPASSLAADYAVLSALANDVGTHRVFARQVEALARPGDVLVGLSTSGSSPNLLAAFAEADRRGLVTVAVTGYGGGPLAAAESAHHRLVVESTSVHRIQEAQAAILAALVDGVRAASAIVDAATAGGGR